MIPPSTSEYLVVERDPSLPDWWPWPGTGVWWCKEHFAAAAFDVIFLIGLAQQPNGTTVCHDWKLYGPHEEPCEFVDMWLIAKDRAKDDELPDQISLLIDTEGSAKPADKTKEE